MTNKLIGKLYEKRGEDILRVYTSESGDVVQIDQHFEGSAFRVISIDFWKETAPELVKLIQEAAGIEPEYEYSVVETYLLLDQDTSEPHHWYDKDKAEEWLKSCEASYESARLEGKPVNFTSKIVKRRKAGPVEDA